MDLMYIELLRNDDRPLGNMMVYKVNGFFYCACGCNVFTMLPPQANKRFVFVCNSCRAKYNGE